MTVEIPPGRPGNLTPDQEEKLRRLWHLIFQVCGVEDENAKPDAGSHQGSGAGKAEKPKKKRISLFSRKPREDADSAPDGPVPSSGAITALAGIDSKDDKYGQAKHFYDTLASQSPQSIRDTIWTMVKHDHPDALVLRFLRARKWDVEKALVMLVSTMNWRAQEMHVDDDIMANGEAAALDAERGADPAAKKLGGDFLAQIRMGKSFLHGIDKGGRPICVVRVRLHHQGEQAEESLERYTVYIIETARMLLTPPVDTATIVFDMTGFSRANLDYTPVRFMIKCFEANYPESLGTVLVHKAPWIFQGIWKIIKGWLDPVVASKVHFTNNMEEMGEFIAPKQTLKELDGEEDWDYRYVEPISGENDRMKDTNARDRLLGERERLYRAYEKETMEWIRNPEGEKAREIRTRRDAIAASLREDYWKLDPYIRARSLYDRTGVLQLGGKLDYYPAVMAEGGDDVLGAKGQGKAIVTKEQETAVEIEAQEKVNGSVPETSADDVD